MTRPLTPLTPAMTLVVTFALLVALTSQVEAKCDFPDFLQIKDPWAGDYRNGLLVAYVKQSYILLRETVEGGNFISFRRECRQKVPDNKYLLMHKEKDQSPQYLCMEFIQRGANIVQVKTSKMDPRQSQDLCDEKEMAIDPFPLVQMGTATPTEEPCPFRGGYNFFAYYALPNNTLVCNNLLLLMRIESECEQGGGITINFRKKECVPKGLPEQAEHRAHCVTHWTQGPYTFVVLRHAEESDKWFCLRTSDPLSNIQDAYLWMEVVIDTSEEPDIKTSRNYLKLQLTNRIFSSTCADEIEICAETTHYCNMGLSR
ncbi:uncharacterized protein LOC101850669 [Aplysia californica]|uniref:Uncharacterized protein LOC101850669 n=1 Tax=Aplysia californica TaxID=6500 RepID=A0ABM1A805_APLCA|nr:uncharacterized protein LOC101850669 [Aplysia californica]